MSRTRLHEESPRLEAIRRYYEINCTVTTPQVPYERKFLKQQRVL